MIVHDRKLGDEWEEWDGDLSQMDVDVETGKRVFLGFAILSIFLLAIGTALVWYLIKPRIQEINLFFSQLMEIVVIIFIVVLFICFFLTVLSILVRKNLLIGFKEKKFSISFLTPLILKLGEKFGVSYDCMGNSFIKVSNSLIKTTKRKITNSNIIILLPRCLRKPIQKKIVELAKKYECLIFTVPGGELARKIIAREKPKAVIGVACERDLMSGIRDVRKIPVIGITNKRPEGPCKNTVVNFEEIEEAICYFLNIDNKHQMAH